MKKNMLKWLAVAMLLPIIIFSSCEKIEVEQGFTTFGEVYFVADQTASYQAGHLKIKYNGNPIELQGGTGRIRVPEGEGKFEFYDERTGEVLGEKTVSIIAENPEKYNLFQPTENDAIAFLDPNGQDNEEAAPDGFMKIKIANYATNLLPDPVDIVFHGLVGRTYVVTDTIRNIGANLGEEEYHLVKRGGVAENRPTYQLSFINRKTKEEIKNIGETIFFSTTISANGTKHIYTLFLSSSERDYEAPSFLKLGDKFYTIIPNVLNKD